jgi:hypothetical protein
MGSQVNTNQIAGLHHNNPRGSVCDWENLVTGFDPIVTDIFLQPISDFLGQK